MIFGLILIIIGLVFLLQNLGFVSEGAWSIIWPAVLILLGLALVFKRKNHGFFWEERFGWRKKEIEKEKQ